MRTRRSRERFHEPSLVPLADMLTNTVGIVLFILIFTVLTAGGVMVAKRLPIEQTTDKDSLLVVCADGKMFPVADDLQIRSVKSLGELTRDSADSWLEKFKALKFEDNYFTVTGSVVVTETPFGQHRDVVLDCIPRSDRGENVARLKQGDSDYQLFLKSHPPEKWFVYYLLRPDSVAAFQAARDLAVSQYGYSVGWTPLSPEHPLRLSITGSGATPTPQ